MADPTGQQARLLQRGLLIGIALAVLALTLLAAHWRPLWYDELFTFYVARQPTAIGTVQALLAGADTNPPLDYLLRHAAMALLGASSAAFRLPSALAFIAGLLATYAFVRRRVPFIPAVMALLLPVATAAVYFAYEGRAYALLFASGDGIITEAAVQAIASAPTTQDPWAMTNAIERRQARAQRRPTRGHASKPLTGDGSRRAGAAPP